jgi:hypothetical protein
MKDLIVSLIVAGSLLVALSSPAWTWCCPARSPAAALGWATNYSLSAAQYTALSQCAIHTPRGFVCIVNWCR